MRAVVLLEAGRRVTYLVHATHNAQPVPGETLWGHPTVIGT